MLIWFVTWGSVWVGDDDSDPVFTWPAPRDPPPHHPHGWHGSPSEFGRNGPNPHCGARPAATDECFRNPVPKTSPTPPRRHIKSKSYALHVLSQCGRGKRSPHIVIQRQNNKTACLAFECWIFIVSVLRKGKMGTMGRLGDDVGSLSAVRESDLDEKGRLPAAQAEREREREIYRV